MIEPWIIVCVFIVGLILGGIYFAGLWWTVNVAVVSKRPAVLFLTSLLLRTSFVLVGFYFIGRGHWERFLICLLGFIAARFIVTWLTRNKAGYHAS